MKQFTEISPSDESIVVNRILKTVSQALKNQFGIEVDTQKPAQRKHSFVDNEVTAITNLGGNKAPLPPPPSIAQNHINDRDRMSNTPPPFAQNDKPENSAFAISGHGFNENSRASDSLYGDRLPPTSAFGGFMSEPATTDVSNIQPIHAIKLQKKRQQRRRLLNYSLFFLFLAGVYAYVYFYGLETIIYFFKG